MDKLTIKTNHVPRQLVYGFELTDKQKTDFDYIDDIDSHNFFIYKGEVYDLGEFMAVNHGRECLPEEFKKWHGYQSNSFFSGLLIKYTDDMESVIVGFYMS